MLGGAAALLWLALRASGLLPWLSDPRSASVLAASWQSADLALAERLDARTAPLLGARYQLSPLGEGQGPDPDPRFRLDAFDCTTLVETAMALTLAPTARSAPALLDRIRYRQGRPEFLGRRHFPEAEWIPELTALGLLRDRTRELGGPSVRLLRRTPPRSPGPEGPDVPRWRLPSGPIELPVWPIDEARRGYRSLPAGLVLSLVRADQPDALVLVTHQGLVLRRDGVPVLRHAASPRGAVIDEPLGPFLERVAGWSRWPVLGIHLATLVDLAQAPGTKLKSARATAGGRGGKPSASERTLEHCHPRARSFVTTNQVFRYRG